MTDRVPDRSTRAVSSTGVMKAIDLTKRAEETEEGKLRKAGRQLIFAMHAALRAVKLYPVENVAVQRALGDVVSRAQELATEEGVVELRISGEFIFVNGTRLRLDLENFASFSHLLAMFRTSGVGALTVASAVASRDWLVFLSLLQSAGTSDDAGQVFADLTEKLTAASIRAITIGPASEGKGGGGGGEPGKERARRTYAQSVAATREIMTSVRLGQSPNVRKIKRLVQGIVDQILNDETSLMGLTTIRDYDEYTFTHSINVCILSVALGKRVGLTKGQLYDLGLAALFHDIGKSRVPAEILNKSVGLNDTEWRMIANHPWLGVLALFQLRGAQELPYRAMIVAHEHHMKRDLTGYPKPLRPRRLSMFSKIVAVADGFDAATSRRAYQSTPFTPADVILEMRDNPRRGMDPVIVKAFINLTGIYPVGTLVLLDTFELGIVQSPNAIEDLFSRPMVRVISDEQGNVVFPGALADLADTREDGSYTRTIIKTQNPERYGIRVSDYVG